MKTQNHLPKSQRPQEPVDGRTAERTGESFVEFSTLMSLALDGKLSESETQQFEADLAEYSVLAEDWALWQQIHTQFEEAPAVAPPCDFMQKFQQRLTQQIRRRNLRFGIVLGVLTVVMWLSVVVGGVAVGAYILDHQSVWLGQFVHNATYLLNIISLWGNTLLETASTVLYMPQVWGIALGYLTLVALILTYWTRFLRRSTYVLSEV